MLCSVSFTLILGTNGKRNARSTREIFCIVHAKIQISRHTHMASDLSSRHPVVYHE